MNVRSPSRRVFARFPLQLTDVCEPVRVYPSAFSLQSRCKRDLWTVVPRLGSAGIPLFTGRHLSACHDSCCSNHRQQPWTVLLFGHVLSHCWCFQMGIRVMDSNDQERERGITILAKVRGMRRRWRVRGYWHLWICQSCSSVFRRIIS